MTKDKLKSRINRGRFLSLASLGALVWLWAPTPVLANNPPEPQAIFAVLGIPLTMYILTVLGGAHVVMHNLEPPKAGLRGALGSLGNGLAYAFFIVMAMATEGGTGMAALVFGIMAIQRGLKMIYWSRWSKPVRQLGVDRPKLLVFGCILLVLEFFLVTTPFFIIGNEGYFPRKNRRENLAALCDVAATAIERAEEMKNKGERPDYRKILAKNGAELNLSTIGYRLLAKPFVELEFTNGPEGEGSGFVMHLHPAKMPPWPWNKLLSKPVYRIDQTGDLQMMRTHWTKERCNPQAQALLNVKNLGSDGIPDGRLGDLAR